MKPRSLTDRTVGGFLWMSTGAGAEALLRIGVLVVLARLLSPQEFGLVGAAVVVLSFAQIVGELGVGPALVQRSELSPAHVSAGYALSVTLTTLTAACLFFGAGVIADFFRMPGLETVVRYMALIGPVAGLGLVSQSLLQKHLGFRTIALIEVASFAIGYGAVGIVLAVLDYGAWALIGAHVAQTALRTILLLVQNPVRFSAMPTRRAMTDLLDYGTGFSIAKVGNALAQQADNIVVGRWMGTEALGLYGRAYSFLMMPANLVGKVVDKVLFAAMSVAQQDRERLVRAFVRSVTATMLVSGPVSVMMIVCAPEIVGLLLGPAWDGVVAPLRALAVILMFRIGYKMSDSLVRAVGAVYRRAWRQWVYAGAVFAGAWAGHHWGIGGVGAGVAAAVALNYLLMLQLTVRLLDLSWAVVTALHGRYIGLTAVAVAVVWPAAEAARASTTSDLVVLAVAGAALGIVLVVYGLLRRQTLDDNGRWVVNLILGRVAGAVRGK